LANGPVFRSVKMGCGRKHHANDRAEEQGAPPALPRRMHDFEASKACMLLSDWIGVGHPTGTISTAKSFQCRCRPRRCRAAAISVAAVQSCCRV